MPVVGTCVPSSPLSRGLKLTVLIKDGKKRDHCQTGSIGLNYMRPKGGEAGEASSLGVSF